MPNSKYFIEARLSDGTDFKISKDMFNEVYLPYFFTKDRVNVLFGGAGSGKSVSVFDSAVLNNILYDRNYLVLTREKKMAVTSCYNEVVASINKFGLKNYFKTRQQPKQITCLLNGRTIGFEGCEDVEQLKSYKVPVGSINDIIMEEATNFKASDYDQLLIRQRGIDLDSNGNVIVPRMWVVFNPISKAHWLYKNLFMGKWNEKTDKKVRYHDYHYIGGEVVKLTVSILKTTHIDNKFLTKEDRATLLNTKDKNRYNVYVLGNFGSLGKTIFAPNENFFIETGLRERINDMKGVIRMGLDFSGGVADHAFVKAKLDKKGKKIYIYDEFMCPELPIDQLWSIIKPKVVGCGYVTCDVGNESRKRLKALGCPIRHARKGSNSVSYGLSWLKEYEIYIDSRCTGIIGNFELYSWKKNRLGEYIEIPEDVNNDGIDSLRYAMSYDMANKNKMVKTNISLY